MYNAVYCLLYQVKLGPDTEIRDPVMLIADPPESEWADDEPADGRLAILFICLLPFV